MINTPIKSKLVISTGHQIYRRLIISSVWSAHNAKAKFSKLLNTTIHSTPQIITKRGHEVAVLVSIEEWQRLQAQAKLSLKELLLSDMGRTDELVLPDRQKQQTKRRDIPKLN